MADLDPVTSRERIDLAGEQEFDLGGLKVKPADCAVVMDGERRDVQPRVMQVLVALAKARPKVVSRDRLVQLCWGGRIVGDDAINRCVLALRHLAQEFSPAPFEIETVPRVGHRLVEDGKAREFGRVGRPSRALFASAAAVLLVLAGGTFLTRSWNRPHPPTVLVTAAANDRASQDLARDVAAKLASFQPIQSSSMRLVGNADRMSVKSDLTLQVGPVPGGGPANPKLVLTTGHSQAILWSKDFELVPGNAGDLEEQMAVTAARVLDCAGEALASPDRLNEQALKTYVSACAALADRAYNSESLVPMLRQVTESAPRFAAGWARLLYAEIDADALHDFVDAAALKPQLERDVADARKLDPEMAEAYEAEAFLLPDEDYLNRERLLQAAVLRNPTNASAHLQYARFLGDVGRLGEAVLQAREAVRFDSLSPAVRDEYVTDLAVAGRFEAARAALAESERLWPGAASLRDSRYRFNLRFGDAREALRMLRSGEVDYPGANMQAAFLEARIDPLPGKVNAAIEKAMVVVRTYPGVVDGPLQTLAQFGRKEEIFQLLLGRRRPDDMEWVNNVIFRPAFRDVHRDPRFMLVANRFGLLDYWRRTNNWPDLCFAPGLPYDCKAEAARIAG